MMRINAIMNRYHANNASIPTNEYICGNLRIELDARIVTIDGVKIEMTPKEYDLLIYLITNENTVVRREELLSKIWGYNFFGDDRTLDTHMKLLRRKLGSYGKNIVTLRGVGYRFDK
jgi:DNA-binding response OmpR family regulator